MGIAATVARVHGCSGGMGAAGGGKAMRAIRATVLVAALMLLAGCAGLAGSAAFSTPPPKPGFAALYVGRPGGWHVSLVPLGVELDDRPLALLPFNSYTRIELRPGRYRLAAADNYMSKVTFGMPRGGEMTVQAGRSYFALPAQIDENPRPSFQVIGTTVIATTATDRYGTFLVAEKDAGAPAPPAFAPLSYVAPAEASAGPM
jgi:hypothetical protein